MTFSGSTLHQCWELAQGRCECQRIGHRHLDRCNRPLVFERLEGDGPGAWHAVPWTESDEGEVDDDPANCEAVCQDCYERMIGVWSRAA